MADDAYRTRPEMEISGNMLHTGWRKAAECTPRAGLPNFFRKCENGGPVKVAYFGGSITCAAGWRVYSLDYFRSLYPQAEFEEIHAAIGGTDSTFGVYRLGHHVLRFKPDLVFVEFATNDAHRRKERDVEGIVRNLYSTLPECDICFVYTVGGESAQTALQEGWCNVGASTYEDVADAYQVPSIHMGMEAARLAREGKLIWKMPRAVTEQVSGKKLDRHAPYPVDEDGRILFAVDDAHAYLDTGHRLYEEAIERAIPVIRQAAQGRMPHTDIPPPLHPDPVRVVTFRSVEEAKSRGMDLSGSWRIDMKIHSPDWTDAPEFYRYLPTVWRGEPPAALAFRFTGKTLIGAAIIGPGSGRVACTVDGVTEEMLLFDEYCAFWRLTPVTFARDLDPGKVHSIVLRALPDEVRKAECFAHKPGAAKIHDDHRESFAPNDVLLGGFFLEAGEIVADRNSRT